MAALLTAFACLLLLAVLVSSLAHRTILSTAALFLVAGFVLGDGVLGVVSITAEDEMVGTLAELALFAVLFTDGMRVGWQDLRSAWRLPGRALGWGLPLTLVVTTLGAHYLLGLGWIESLLIGAILAPTDPVFAAALVGNEKVPPRLRQLLNVESGVNDGLALPFVMVFLAIAAGSGDLHLGELGSELGLGILIGRGWRSGWNAPASLPPPPSTSRSTRWPSACSCSHSARPRTATCSWPRSPPGSPWPPSGRVSASRSSTSVSCSPSCSSWRRCWCSARC
jgi:NhaP-type Na+/H+ or K+/H+ antiporter